MNTKKQRILITGTRAPSALEIARQFDASGCIVFTAESIKHPLCRLSKSVSRTFHVPSPAQNPKGYIEALKDIIKKQKIDLLIPACEEIFTIAQYKGLLQESCEVFCDEYDKLIRLHDKWRFIGWAEELELDALYTWKLESYDDLEALVQHDLPFDILLKPVFSRFASKVYRIDRKAVVLPGIIISKEQPWVAQKYLEGDAFCTYSIVKEGRLLAHTTYPVRMQAKKGACIYFEQLKERKIELWIRQFVKKTCFTGQIAFDFIQDKSGIFYPIECNPRATSGVHLFDDSSSLAPVFLGRSARLVEPKPGTKKMLALAMFFFGWPFFRSFKKAKTWLSAFYQAKDVLFKWSDPGPFIYQFLTLFTFFKIAVKTKKNLLEASTHDIEWNG